MEGCGLGNQTQVFQCKVVRTTSARQRRYYDSSQRNVDEKGKGRTPQQIRESYRRKRLVALQSERAGDIALARSEGVTRDQVAARKRIARDFYVYVGGYSEKGARQDMKGIDFNKPLRIGPPPAAPAHQTQWQAPGARQGQYYGDAGTSPTVRGINDEGRVMGPGGWGSGPISKKAEVAYSVAPETPYLESTAASVVDDWSVTDLPTETQGGAVQRMVPRAAGVHPVEIGGGT